MHRDIGCYMLRGLTPRRIFSNLLGKDTGASRGRDANLHGMGDLSHNIVGYISHLPQSLPVAVGVAMSFKTTGAVSEAEGDACHAASGAHLREL